MDNNSIRCAIDHILEAQEKGEINEDNVLYIVENINVAGTFCFSQQTVLNAHMSIALSVYLMSGSSAIAKHICHLTPHFRIFS
jgi:hypothetical protein